MSGFEIDPAFQDASIGKSAGVMKWRIENKCPVLQSSNDGRLHTGDAYIILNTTENASNKFSYAIHFWLGEECSVDESGIAAYKSCELDEALGGIAVQHRECQGNESTLFSRMFKDSGGLQYLPGGVDSGFTHVERDQYETRLLQVKGKRNVRVREVPVSASSLTQDDVYILDLGLELFVWYGANANKYEKAKGLQCVSNIKDDQRGGRAKVIRVDEDPQNETFWSTLGGYTTDISEGEPDDSVPSFPPNKILKVSDASGNMECIEVELENGKMMKSHLNSDDAFIVIAQGDVYIWVGKGCTMQEKKEATANAVSYIASSGMDKETRIERLSDGFESGKFKALFASWEPPVSFKRMSNVAAAVEEQEVDVTALLSRSNKMNKMVDDGSGKVEVFIVRDFKLEELPVERHGEFHGGDCYVVSYTYLRNGKEMGLIYFWLGRDSSADEKGSAALLAKEMDDNKFNGGASQWRVTQGREPPHFASIFKGEMVVLAGGHASGFANSNEEDTLDTDGTALFRIRGTQSSTAYATQVDEVAASLNGDDCFVLVNPANCYVWSGNASTDEEKATAFKVGKKVSETFLNQGGRELSEVAEGSEPEDFWNSLGGQGEYLASSPGDKLPRDPRLFEASDAKGAFRCEEIDNFIQEDLCIDDVYLLDTYSTVFVWIGSGATENEKRKGTELAHKFIECASDDRDEDSNIVLVHAGSESVLFTQHFNEWDEDFINKRIFKDPYAAKLAAMKAEEEKKMAELEKEEAAAPAPAPAPAPAAAEGDITPGSYTAEQLRGRIPGVIPHKKEMYLSDSEFTTCFNMSRDDFAKLPAWKAKAAKQKVGLF